ncbi:LytTR family DNA-binding domain-containing protein [Nibrella saemangeumensis]|uniref:LytTR family DNA-binding domain-containing protein n=1 Tax=Nibrella saemangeumensis TaxID=1084526 RepID=A0ABP8NQQ0_9BACT
MKVILVDDERPALITLRHKLLKYDSSIEILAMCEEPEDGLEQIGRLKPDVVFLDVEMPGMNGFDLLEQLPKIDFEVVFTTAHDEFTIQAIRVSAFDYLLKPVDEEDLRKTLERLIVCLKEKEDRNHFREFQYLLKSLRGEPEKVKKLPIATMDGILLLPLSDIIRIEAMGSYTAFYCSKKQKIVASKSISEFDHLCHNDTFFKVHKSHIINLNFVEKYIRGEGGSVILADGSEVGVSRRSKAELLERLFLK